MTPFRAVVSSTLPILVLLSLALPADVRAQSAAKVLVAPLTTSGGVDVKFGGPSSDSGSRIRSSLRFSGGSWPASSRLIW
jgi:hypothetical protein